MHARTHACIHTYIQTDTHTHTLYYITLQYNTLHYILLNEIVLYYITLRYTLHITHYTVHITFTWHYITHYTLHIAHYTLLRRWRTKTSLQTTALLQRARADTLLAVFFTRGPLHASPAEPDLLPDHLARSRIEYPFKA